MPRPRRSHRPAERSSRSYYGFGTDDFYVTIDFPDHAAAAAAALTIGAAGTTRARTVVLLTPEEIDAATQKSVDYRPPGG